MSKNPMAQLKKTAQEVIVKNNSLNKFNNQDIQENIYYSKFPIPLDSNDDETYEAAQKVKNLDQFKHLISELDSITNSFTLRKYTDCQLITSPKENENMFLVVQGSVNVINSESDYKEMDSLIKKSRKKKDKEMKNLINVYGKEYVDAKIEIKFETDFPTNNYRNQEYKRVRVNQTFGNDKLVTNKGYRPSFVISEGISTVVLVIPVAQIEGCIYRIANSGENLEKAQFFRKFDWFNNWTTSLRTKFLDHITKKTFYRGQKIITEGTNEQYMYVIAEGVANLVKEARFNEELFKKYECEDDPTRAKRYEEYKKILQPHKKTTIKDLYQQKHKKGTIALEDQFGTIQTNGYVSKTLKSIFISQKGAMEWIGEGFFSMKNPETDPFGYSVIAQTAKVECFSIHCKNLRFMPQYMKKQMIENAKARAGHIQRTYEKHYQNLKQIKKNLFTLYHEIQIESGNGVQKQISQIIEEAQTKKMMPSKDEFVIRKEQEIIDNLKQKHEVSIPFCGKSYLFTDGCDPEIFSPPVIRTKKTINLGLMDYSILHGKQNSLLERQRHGIAMGFDSPYKSRSALSIRNDSVYSFAASQLPQHSNRNNLKEKQLRSMSKIEQMNPHIMSKDLFNHYHEPLKMRANLMNSHTLLPSVKQYQPIFKSSSQPKLSDIMPKIQKESIVAQEFTLKQEKQAEILENLKFQRKKVSRLQTLELQKDHENVIKRLTKSTSNDKAELKLKQSYFSIKDKFNADKLLQNEKLKLQVKQQVQKHHPDIEIFSSKLGTRSIRDFDYKQHSQGTMISLKVANKLGGGGLKEIPEKFLSSFNTSISHSIAETVWGEEKWKNINLNHQIPDDVIQQMVIDENLAQKLMMQDEHLETHHLLNFNQRELMIKEQQKPEVLKISKDFGKRAEGQGVETQFTVKNRQITPNPFYHAQKRKLLHRYQEQLLEEQIQRN